MDDDQWRGVGTDDDYLVISTELIRGLGDELDMLAETLESAAEDSRPNGDGGFAFPPAGQQLGRILRDYEKDRHILCEGLRALSGLAHNAGAAYFEAETSCTSLAGGTR